jgi:pyridoxal phosphate enzyme (YggS family)
VEGLAARFVSLRERVARAAERSGREASAVRLVGVTKTVPAERVALGIAAGLRDVGESRIQEALPKLDAIEAGVRAGELELPTWHFVGHLQSNKARRAAARFDWIETVDSPRLAEALDRHCAELGRKLRVLIEVNVAGEHQKAGVAPGDVSELVDGLAGLKHLELRGLMTVGPRVDRPDEARAAFRALARARDAERTRRPELALDELSMGMSGDFEVAVEEGATIVRVGSLLFGARD